MIISKKKFVSWLLVLGTGAAALVASSRAFDWPLGGPKPVRTTVPIVVNEAPLAREFVGGAPADPQHRGGFLDGEHVGEVVERYRLTNDAKIPRLRHSRTKLRPCHSMVNCYVESQ